MAETLPAAMSEADARSLTDRIRDMGEEVWRLLFEAHERHAWVPLGYVTWRAYVRAEFGMTDRNARHLLTQAQVTRAIEAASGTAVPPGTITNRAARDIAPVLDDVVADVKDRTRRKPAEVRPKIVAEVVAEHRPATAPPGFERPDPADEAPLAHPSTKDEVRRLVALITTVGADTLAHSCTVEALSAAAQTLSRAHRVAYATAAKEASPVAATGRCSCKVPTMSKHAPVCTTCGKRR